MFALSSFSLHFQRVRVQCDGFSSSIFFVFIKVTTERACWAFLFLFFKRHVPREPRHIWLQRMLVMYGSAGW
jgi:hypothetical protein